MKRLVLRIPSSTANFGSGFDAIGGALSLYLIVTVFPDTQWNISSTCGDLPTHPSQNLISQIAINLCKIHSVILPPLNMHIENEIPLGRGLGSSGAAVVAGLLIGNYFGNLRLQESKILDYATIIEGHPDNVSASLLGGIRASCCLDLKVVQGLWSNSDSSLPKELDLAPNLVTSLSIPYSQRLGAVLVIPDFQLKTEKARSVLPSRYSREDIVYNLQRVSVLTLALKGNVNGDLDSRIISTCMKDRIHQEYRQPLVPGLDEILTLSPDNIPGLLGVCLSGAGPTVCLLADSNHEAIGEEVVDIFRKFSIASCVKILDFTSRGSIQEENDV